ncbi:hypothetical protein RP20_CCG003968 [Aedes albopictus]|nr:hypothetical protein RP20_CCG003968 [Aedes albopictus]
MWMATIQELQDVSRQPSLESLTGGDGHLHPGHAYHNGHRRSPSLRRESPLVRTPSPRRRHHDVGFSDTVSNVVEIQKEEHKRGPPGHVQHSYPVLVARRQGQGRRLPPTPCKPSTLQLKQTNINFPKLNASPTHTLHSTHTTPHSIHSLPPTREFLRERDRERDRERERDLYYRERDRERDRERYRSSREREARDYGPLHYEFRDRERELYEREIEREFEREYERMEHQMPLSYEQALAMGRTGGRVLPSPILNGYKPKGGLHSSRHSDSDDEDWC